MFAKATLQTSENVIRAKLENIFLQIINVCESVSADFRKRYLCRASK